jgi:SAM-dependent methyltransferase
VITDTNPWENLSQKSWGSVWPWSDLISLFEQSLPHLLSEKSNDPFKVLEVGIGIGANIPYFESKDLEYIGIDFSATNIRRAKEKFPTLKSRLHVMDFTRELPNGNYEFIIDRASVIHNTLEDISVALKLIYSHLKPGGIFIGIDWFSKNHSDWLLDAKTLEIGTKESFVEGQFKGMGKIHFTDKFELESFLQSFEVLRLSEKIVIENDGKKFASFNFVARKPQ